MIWYLAYTIVYFSILFAIGIYYFSRVKSSDEYLIAGWNMGFWAITGTIVSTASGAAVFVGWVGLGFTAGLSGYVKFALPAMLTSILLVVVFSRPLRRQKLYTLADLFAERFGPGVGLIPSIFSALIYSVPTTALQIVGMGTLFVTIFEMPQGGAILVAFAAILGFTILGGLVATIVTDALQSVVLVLGIVGLLIAAVSFGGGPGAILGATDPVYLSPTGPEGLGEVLTFALTIAPFYLVWQSTWQRIFASRDPETAVRAGVSGFGLMLVISFIPFAIGISAMQFVPAHIQPDLIFSYLTVELLPPALGGIVAVGLLSALMTGANSFILQGSSNLTQDVYIRLIRPEAGERERMAAARGAVVVIAALSLAVAFAIDDIIGAYQWALRLSGTTLVVPFLAAMFWRGTTAAGCAAAMLSATAITLLWPLFGTSVDPVFPGLAVCTAVLGAVSLLTRHSDRESVRAIYHEDLPSAARR